MCAHRNSSFRKVIPLVISHESCGIRRCDMFYLQCKIKEGTSQLDPWLHQCLGTWLDVGPWLHLWLGLRSVAGSMAGSVTGSVVVSVTESVVGSVAQSVAAQSAAGWLGPWLGPRLGPWLDVGP